MTTLDRRPADPLIRGYLELTGFDFTNHVPYMHEAGNMLGSEFTASQRLHMSRTFTDGNRRLAILGRAALGMTLAAETYHTSSDPRFGHVYTAITIGTIMNLENVRLVGERCQIMKLVELAPGIESWDKAPRYEPMHAIHAVIGAVWLVSGGDLGAVGRVLTRLGMDENHTMRPMGDLANAGW